MKWEKILILVVINIVLYVSIDLMFLYPLRHKNKYGFTSIYKYTERKSISDLDNTFKKVLNDIDLNDNTDISFNDTFVISITRNDFRYRGIGSVHIKGKYKSIDDLINFLNSLEIEYNIEDITNNKNTTIYISDKASSNKVSIDLTKQGEITISCYTNLPYKYNLKNYNYEGEFEKYFIAINEKNATENIKKINNIYVKEFFFLLYQFT